MRQVRENDQVEGCSNPSCCSHHPLSHQRRVWAPCLLWGCLAWSAAGGGKRLCLCHLASSLRLAPNVSWMGSKIHPLTASPFSSWRTTTLVSILIASSSSEQDFSPPQHSCQATSGTQDTLIGTEVTPTMQAWDWLLKATIKLINWRN